MPTNFVNDYQKGRLQWFIRGVAIIAIISGLFTYFGASAAFGAITWVDKTLAAALAIGSSTMIFLISKTLLASALQETSPLGRIASLFKTALGCGAIAAASSWFMVAGFAENTVDQVQLSRGVAKIERYTDATHGQALQIRTFLPGISSLAQELAKRSELEKDKGVSTGTPGDGPVSSELLIASEDLTKLAWRIATAVRRVEAGHEAAAAQIAAMRAAANGSASATERWETFGESAVAWRATLARMNTDEIAHEVISGLKSASRDLGAVVKLSSRPSTAADQQAAFEKYRDLIARKAQPIIARVEAHLRDTSGEPPIVSRKNVAIVVLQEWDAFVAMWVLGLSLDLAAPLLMLISLHVSTATTTPSQRFAQEVLGSTVHDEIVVEARKWARKSLGIEDRVSKSVSNALIGHDPDADEKREDDDD